MKNTFNIYFWGLALFLPIPLSSFGSESYTNSIDSSKLINSTDWKIKGNLRARTELDGRDFSNLTYPPITTHMRTRLSIEKSLNDLINFYVQLQDSRIFGMDSPSGNPINLNIYQAFAEIKKPFDIPLDFKIGRFELEYGNGRHFSGDDWSVSGKSFDGISISYKNDFLKLDAFNLLVKNKQSYIDNPTPDQYSFPSKPDLNHSLYGLWNKISLLNQYDLDLFAYYELNRNKTNFNDYDLSRYNIGLNYLLILGKDWGNFELESNYQFGFKANKEVSANQYSIAYTNRFDNFILSGKIESTSGQKPNDATQFTHFEANFGRKHGLYGDMDYFNNPASIGYLGVSNIKLSFAYDNILNPFNYQIDAFIFQTEKTSMTDLSYLGSEIDLKLKYLLRENTKLELGTCVFFQGELMKEFYAVNTKTLSVNRDNLGFWTYLQLRIDL